ncbi:hypothetical protein K474DRAFT_482810 [Panus rudis PR-1116 ss-1]|nr:hypothetical protein K474DRAFT_482810 [Panus rudis PR-1116 ss-1]
MVGTERVEGYFDLGYEDGHGSIDNDIPLTAQDAIPFFWYETFSSPDIPCHRSLVGLCGPSRFELERVTCIKRTTGFNYLEIEAKRTSADRSPKKTCRSLFNTLQCFANLMTIVCLAYGSCPGLNFGQRLAGRLHTCVSLNSEPKNQGKSDESGSLTEPTTPTISPPLRIGS